jgi:hypothetical protein
LKHVLLRVRTEEFVFSNLLDTIHNWTYSVHSKAEKLLSVGAPVLLDMTLSHYVDATLMHDIATVRSATGIIHPVDMTPIGWYFKEQATVKTATYRSEIVVARICVEPVIDLHNTLRFLNVSSYQGESYMFEDSKSVVDSSMHLNVMLSFHLVRKNIAAETFLPGIDSFENSILCKHWGDTQNKERSKVLVILEK